MVLGIAKCAVATFAGPKGFIPFVPGLTAVVLGKVHALKSRPVVGHGDQSGDIKRAIGVVGNHPVGGTFISDALGQAAGINAGNPDPAMFGQPVVEMFLCAVV